MGNTDRTQSQQNSLTRQSHTPNGLRSPGDVRQDKHAPKRVRIATSQPVVRENPARTRTMDTKISRPQNYNKKRSTKRKTVQIAGWISPQLKAELQRIAEQEKLSLSRTVAAIIEEGVRQKLHIQHAVLLQPIIETTIKREITRYSNRLAFLLVRVAYASEQTRAIAANILKKQPGITDEKFNRILDGSSKAAKRNITERSPQLETIITELEKLFKDDGEEGRGDG